MNSEGSKFTLGFPHLPPHAAGNFRTVGCTHKHCNRPNWQENCVRLCCHSSSTLQKLRSGKHAEQAAHLPWACHTCRRKLSASSSASWASARQQCPLPVSHGASTAVCFLFFVVLLFVLFDARHMHVCNGSMQHGRHQHHLWLRCGRLWFCCRNLSGCRTRRRFCHHRRGRRRCGRGSDLHRHENSRHDRDPFHPPRLSSSSLMQQLGPGKNAKVQTPNQRTYICGNWRAPRCIRPRTRHPATHTQQISAPFRAPCAIKQQRTLQMLIAGF